MQQLHGGSKALRQDTYGRYHYQNRTGFRFAGFNLPLCFFLSVSIQASPSQTSISPLDPEDSEKQQKMFENDKAM